MADANVILRIGSALGPGGLASLKAGWDMTSGLAKSISETTKELDRFKVMMNQVDMSLINYADSAAKGQIDTAELMRGLQKLNEAGAKTTKEEFKTLAVQVVNHSKAVGKDATQEWDRLTTAIARGSSRALTEYGIRLKESTNLQKTQKEAIKGLTEGFNDMNVELTTGSERLYQLSNNWGTFTAAMWSAVGDIPVWSDAVDSLNSVLGETVKAITETTNATRSWVFQWENFREIVIPTLQMLGGLLTGNITPAVAAYAARFKNLINKGLSDENLRKANAAEIAAKAAAQGRMRAAQTRGGAGDKSVKDPMAEIDQAWIDELNEQLREAQAPIITPAGISIEEKSPFEGFSLTGRAERDVEIEEKLLKLKEREANLTQNILDLKQDENIIMIENHIKYKERIALLSSEEYQEARLKEMREDEQIYRAERKIELEFQREQALDFAQTFGDTWAAAMDRISAGAMAADGTLQIMRGTWGAIVTSAIEGHNGIGEAIRETIKAVGIQIAIEAGLMALLSAGRAIYYAATRQYASATKAGLAAASFAATAVVAGVAAATASAFGKSAKSIQQVSIPSSASSGSATPSYGGSYSGGQQAPPQEVVIRLAPDAGSQMFEVVQQQNTMARRSGTTSFTEAA